MTPDWLFSSKYFIDYLTCFQTIALSVKEEQLKSLNVFA
jgi:hypothetical protein